MGRIKTGLFFFLPMLFLNISLKAQQEFIVGGVLFEKGTKNRVSGTEISNKRNNYATISNGIGLFSIKAKIGDTLLMTKLYYNDVNVIVNSNKDMVIQFIKNTNSLNEVVISSRRVVDDLKRDFKNAPPSGKAAPLAYLFSPISSIYGLLSNDGKNARRLSRYYDYEVRASKVDVYYNKSIIQKHTGLEGKKLDDFMINYRPNYERTTTWNQYDAIKWINDSYKKYTDSLKKQ